MKNLPCIIFLIGALSCTPDKKINEVQAIETSLLYVGAYTKKEGHVDGKAKGIYVFEMNQATGEISYVSTSPATISPSYLALSGSKKYLYSANEHNEGTNGQGAISAFTLSDDGRTVDYINQQPTGDAYPCYVGTSQNEKFAVIANYVGGSIGLYPLKENGELSPASSFHEHEGTGPDSRQDAGHAHMITENKVNHLFYAVDLGVDKIIVYELDESNNSLSEKWEVKLKPGVGPRHLVFHPSNNWAYVVNELNGSVTTFSMGKDGDLTEEGSVSTLNEEDDGKFAGCGAIKISSEGKFLYVSNRAEFNNIAIFNIDQNNGSLSLIGHEPSQGEVPRDFSIDPSGKFMLVANQNSSNIVSLKILENGLLEPTGFVADVPTPVCVVFR